MTHFNASNASTNDRYHAKTFKFNMTVNAISAKEEQFVTKTTNK